MPIRKAYADTPEGQIHYRYLLAESAHSWPVVYLHKSASSSQMFEALISSLGDDFSGYALDNPGFGNSYDPAHAPDTGYYVEALMAAIDGIGLQRFHLVGHHTGACFAVEMAVRYPQRVQSLVLMGPAILTPRERDDFRRHYSTPFNRPVLDGSHLQLTWDYLTRMGVGPSLDLHQREFLDHCRAWRGRCQAYDTVWNQDFHALFLHVTCPMLVTCAEDDVLWPFLARAQQLRPEVTCVVTGGANFEPDRDCAGNSAALRAFFALRH